MKPRVVGGIEEIAAESERMAMEDLSAVSDFCVT